MIYRIFILMLLFSSTAFASEYKALVDESTGEVTNLGRGIDYTNLLEPGKKVVSIPRGLIGTRARHLIYDRGIVQKKTQQEVIDLEKRIEDRKTRQELIGVQKNIDAIQGIPGIDFGEETTRLNRRKTDLIQRLNA